MLKLKYKNILSLILIFLSSSVLNLYGQSANLMKSTPIYGKTPSTTIPVVALNGPTPLEVIGNPFSQPNIQEYTGRGKLEWYGSGDVNNDGKIDSLDLKAMNTMSNDRSDVDGDGTPSTANDKKILGDYLGGKIPYLPGHWNELTTRDERVSWFEKMIKIDKFNENAYNLEHNYGWICGDISTQVQINFYGISDIDNFVNKVKTYSGNNFFKDNAGRFNIPVYQLSTMNWGNLNHSINGILVGNNPLNFEDWYKFSNYTGTDRLNLQPGDIEMIDGPVNIGLEVFWQNPVSHETQFAGIPEIIDFNLTNGIPTLVYNKPYLTLNNPNIMQPHVGALENLVVDSGKYPTGTPFTPEFLQSHGFKAIPDTSKQNTNLPINLSYIDGDTTKLSDTSYQFLRKFYSWIYSGGVTKADSTTQKIEVDKITDVKNVPGEIPKEFKLYQNYPNPFNPSTTIKYSIPSVGAEHVQPLHVLLKVYDLLGREVATLVNEEKSPGNYEVTFTVETRRQPRRDRVSTGGESLPSGIYFYALCAGNYTETKKMLLMK